MAEKDKKYFKEITEEAKAHLDKIFDEVNLGDGRRMFEKEIVSDMVLNFPQKRIGILRDKRVGGNKMVFDELRVSYEEFKAQGGDLAYDDFIKQMVMPNLRVAKKSKKSQNDVQTSNSKKGDQ